MKKSYEFPEIEVVEFAFTDVVLTNDDNSFSGDEGGDGGNGGGIW